MELYHVCKYSIPSFLDIGKLYSILIEDCAKPGDEVSELMKIFSSFISDEISNFNTDLYYQNPNYLEWSYREGKLLDWSYIYKECGFIFILRIIVRDS